MTSPSSVGTGTGTSTVRPFKISVSDSQLQTLHQKLQLTTFPDELNSSPDDDTNSNNNTDTDWSMGVPLAEVKRLTAYWRDSFDWRETEREWNDRLPQFVTTISVARFGKIDIHFVYQKCRSQHKRAIPLLFLHGWPGSFIEVSKLLPLLTEDNEDENQPVFDVVAPSLPNFGFSEGVKKKGFGLVQYAEAMHAVMMALGYSEYVLQGGDWGGILARVMAKLYPDHVKAAHLNFIPLTPPYPWRNPILFLQSLLTIPFSRRDRAKIAVTQNYVTEGSGYMNQQDTRPQTLGYSLHDSPIGLLSWIYEKLHTWTDSYQWTDDEILSWVSIYIFSRAGPAASLRIYYESTHPSKSSPRAMSRTDAISSYAPSQVKIAVAHFPREILSLPMVWNRAIGNVVRETDLEKGGHFAAWEVPEILARDLKAFLGTTGPAYGAVNGRDGY